MTLFESLVLLALTAIVIIAAIGFYAIIQEIKAAREEYKCTWMCIDVVTGILRSIKEYAESIYNGIGADGTMVSQKLTTISNHTYAIEQAAKDLLAFEKRNEKRNDEMFARAEEINKLQLKELQQRVHTYDVEKINEVEQDNSNKV